MSHFHPINLWTYYISNQNLYRVFANEFQNLHENMLSNIKEQGKGISPAM